MAVGGAAAFCVGGRYTYMGLIVSWAFTWLLVQWTITCRFLLAFPRNELIFAVVLPTLFLWIVDGFSLQRGTWVIEKSTKLDIQLWGSLDVEEAFFFFITNVLVVHGLAVADTAIALTHCQQAQSTGSLEDGISPIRIMIDPITTSYDPDPSFVRRLRASVARVASSSQSMYAGSAMFDGPLRIDLIFLYSFCRIMDDLVDEAPNPQVARQMIDACNELLKDKFKSPKYSSAKRQTVGAWSPHLSELIDAIDCLPFSRLHIEPLQTLLDGFQMDLQFNAQDHRFPISTDKELDKYASRVAGTVATCVLDLVVYHYPSATSTLMGDPVLHHNVFQAAKQMGKALQYINIARDIGRDAVMGRVYLPTIWLKQAGLSPAYVIASPLSPSLERVRTRVLERGKGYQDSAMWAVRYLPREVQGPLRATVESYMEIGKVLSRGVRPRTVDEKLRLSLFRRFVVAYKAMANG